MYPCLTSSSSIFPSVKPFPINCPIPFFFRRRTSVPDLFHFYERISFDRISTYNPLALTLSATSPRPPFLQPLEEEEQPLGEEERPLGEEERPLGKEERPLGEEERPLGEEERPLGEEERPLEEEERPLEEEERPLEEEERPLEEEEQLPPKLREIIRLFQSVEEPRAKYEQLLFYGKNLNPLDEVYKTTKNKVEGCVSNVWVRAYLDSKKNVLFEADSDSVLTKGLAALLVIGLSRRPVEEVVRASPKFIVMLGLHQSLTPSRNNGLMSIMKLMKRKALELILEAEKVVSSSFELKSGRGDETRANSEAKSSSGEEIVLEPSSWNEFVANLEAKRGDKVENSDLGGNLGKRGMRIIEKLEKGLSPVELEVEDISHQHVEHAGVRGNDDNETHFNVKIVSKEFEGKSLVKGIGLFMGYCKMIY